MKPKTALLFLVFFALAVSVASADTIEIKGRGFLSGTVVSEEGKELVFRDNDGQILRFLRSDVAYIEREKPRLGNSFLPSPVNDLLGRLSSADISAAPAKHFDYRFDKNVDLANQTIGWLKQLSRSASDFFFRGQDARALVRIAQSKVTGFMDYKSENLVLDGIGMAIMC